MLLTSPLSSPLKNPVRDVFSPAGSSQSLTAQVQALFAGGKVGGMWDMGDTRTLNQNNMATSPGPLLAVTAPGQPIGTVLDKSKSNSWVDNTGSTWTKTSGDGVLSVVGNVITITGATTTTRIDRTGGTIPLVAGTAKMSVTASWATAAGPAIWLRGNPSVPTNGVELVGVNGLANSILERVQIDSGTASFTINSLQYWEGNHATQPTAINRPLYQVDGGYGCAQFDGANDLLQVSGINLSSTDKVLIGLAFKPNTTALTVAMEYSTTAVSNTGAFYVSLNEGGAGLSYFHVNNGGVVDKAVNASAMAAANTTIVEYIDLTLAAATSKSTVRINGAAATLNTVYDGADSPGNFGNYDFFMGARSGGLFPSNMNIHRAFIRAGAATAGEQLILENWLRESCGV